MTGSVGCFSMQCSSALLLFAVVVVLAGQHSAAEPIRMLTPSCWRLPTLLAVLDSPADQYHSKHDERPGTN